MLELLKEELFLREFTQFSMFFAMIANLAVGIVFLYLYTIRKKSVSLYFGLSWLIYGLSHIFKIMRLEQYEVYLDILSKLSISLSIILLIAGIYIYMNYQHKHLKKIGYFLSSLLILLSVIFPIIDLPEMWSNIFIYFIYGIAEIATGLILLKIEKYSSLPAIGMILWGIHKFDYPFLVETSFVVFGYVTSFILGLIVTLGLMIMISLKEYSETIKAYNDLNEAHKNLKTQGKNISKLLLAVSHNLRNPLSVLNEASNILKIKTDTDNNKEDDYLTIKNLSDIIAVNTEKVNIELKKVEQLFEFIDFYNTSNFEPVKVSDILTDLENKLKESLLLQKISICNCISSERLIHADREKLNFTFSSLFFLLDSKGMFGKTKLIIREEGDSILFCFEDLKDRDKLSFIDFNEKYSLSEKEIAEKMLDSEIFDFIRNSISKHNGKIVIDSSGNGEEFKLCVELPYLPPPHTIFL